MSELDPPLAPTGEEIHLPGHSIIPALAAFALAVALLGLTVSLKFTVVGGVLFVLVVIRWVIDTRRDVDQLPLDHH